jgi:hypothetical protein
MQHAGRRLGHILAAIFCLACVSISHAAPKTWEYSEDDLWRSLHYEATVPIMGKATPVSLDFQCLLVSTRCTKSGLKLYWAIYKTEALKPFNFGAFEETQSNPVVENRLMQLTIARIGQPDFVSSIRAKGDETSKGIFVFELHPNSASDGQSPKKQSAQVAEILQALAADGATSLNISVTDSKNAKLKLEVIVPLAAKQAEFRKLLKGLN